MNEENFDQNEQGQDEQDSPKTKKVLVEEAADAEDGDTDGGNPTPGH